MIAKAIHVDPVVTIEMTLREAEILRALVGGIEVTITGAVGKTIRDLFNALTTAGVCHETATFSDFFVGSVKTKAVLK